MIETPRLCPGGYARCLMVLVFSDKAQVLNKVLLYTAYDVDQSVLETIL